jgi:succinate dehydrogenase flavin-adding protein (antitoxin of CptAB toxin-antitoxin module)
MNPHPSRKKLIEYLDKGLESSESLELGKHLEKCPQCRRELQVLQSTLELTKIDTSPQFSGTTWKAPAPRRVSWWRWVMIPAAAAALLVTVILGGDAVMRGRTVEPDEWVVVEGDSLSADQGMELVSLLITEDEEMVESFIAYEETVPEDIYTEIDELSDDEEDALVSLLEEVTRGSERS